MSNVMPLKETILAQFFYFKENIIHKSGSQMFFIGPSLIFTILFLGKTKFQEKLRLSNISLYFLLGLIALASSSALHIVFYYIPFFSVFRWSFKYFLFFLFFYNIFFLWAANIFMRNIKKKKRFIVYSFLLISIILNLMVTKSGSRPDNTFGPYRIKYPAPNYLKNLIKKDEGRIFTFGVSDAVYEQIYKYFTHNFSTLFGYYHFGGYDPLISKLNAKLTLDSMYKSSLNDYLSLPFLDYLSSWSVKYLIAEDTHFNREHLSSFEQLSLIYQGNNILLFENEDSLPFVFFKEDPEKKVAFEFETNGIKIYPQNLEDRTLIVTLAPLDGYQYLIKGENISRTNTFSQGPIELPISANTDQVTIKYSNNQFIIGSVLFLLFWLIALVIVIIRKINIPIFRNLKHKLNNNILLQKKL